MLSARLISFCFLFSLLISSNRAFGEAVTFFKKDFTFPRETGLKKKDLVEMRKSSVPVLPQLPESFDWRAVTPGGLSAVKNQGSCGSCYSFGTTSQLEDLLIIKSPFFSRLVLAPQEIVSCSDNYGCNGGWFNAVWDYVKKFGLPDESQFPYTASNSRCKYKTDSLVTIKDYFYIGEGDEPSVDELKRALILYGPLAVSVYAGGDFMNYGGGVLNTCSRGRDVNHLVELVAFEKDVWVVRNSWGTEYGEDGFIRMKMLDSNGLKCNRIGEHATAVILY
jgi:C1A family cysteine protease